MASKKPSSKKPAVVKPGSSKKAEKPFPGAKPAPGKKRPVSPTKKKK